MMTNKQRKQTKSAIEGIRKQLLKVESIGFDEHDEISSLFANVSAACELIEVELDKLHHPKCEPSPHVFPDGSTQTQCHDDCSLKGDTHANKD